VKAGRLETVELLGSFRVRRADVEALAGQSEMGSRKDAKNAKEER
jgi:hypothetical protein